jgi:hypothetical protein
MTLVVAVLLTIAGLALLAYSDPLFRSSFTTSGEFGNFSSFTRSFNGTFPAGFGNSTLFRGSGGATSQTSRIEGYLGVALIGVGTLLVIVQLLTTPNRSSRRR